MQGKQQKLRRRCRHCPPEKKRRGSGELQMPGSRRDPNLETLITSHVPVPPRLKENVPCALHATSVRELRDLKCAHLPTPKRPTVGFTGNFFTGWVIVDLGFGGWSRLLVQVFQEPPIHTRQSIPWCFAALGIDLVVARIF